MGELGWYTHAWYMHAHCAARLVYTVRLAFRLLMTISCTPILCVHLSFLAHRSDGKNWFQELKGLMFEQELGRLLRRLRLCHDSHYIHLPGKEKLLILLHCFWVGAPCVANSLHTPWTYLKHWSAYPPIHSCRGSVLWGTQEWRWARAGFYLTVRFPVPPFCLPCRLFLSFGMIQILLFLRFRTRAGDVFPPVHY